MSYFTYVEHQVQSRIARSRSCIALLLTAPAPLHCHSYTDDKLKVRVQ
jgi:hypothetical protein